MAINNLNPRRTVWFSPNEPSNKYDIWLSRNAHLDENGEPTTDSDSQRGCDYIFKIYDCGKWNPIVGFNSTAANKIDIVEGNTLYHPAIFTGENPNDLYDAGTLGDLLNNPNFVDPEDWEDIYSTYLKTIIESSQFQLWHAESNRLGGILADTFNSTYTNTSAWMAQCKYKYNASNNYNLYVHAKDIIDAINTYQTDNPSAPGIQPGGNFELWLANTQRIGGIKAAYDPYHDDTPRDIPIVIAGRTHGSIWGGNFGNGMYPQNKYPGDLSEEDEYLYLPGWALIEWMQNPGPGVEIPVPYTPSQIIEVLEDVFKNTSSIGWGPFSLASNPTVSPHIWGADAPQNAGRFLRIKNPYPQEGTGWAQNNHAMEWVDIQEGDGIDININDRVMTIGIKTDGAQPNQVLTKTQNGVDWMPQQGTEYGYDNLIDITNNTVSISMNGAEAGNVIICDGSNNNYSAKWGAVPNPDLATISIVGEKTADLTLNGNILSISGGDFTIDGQLQNSSSIQLNYWKYYIISSFRNFTIAGVTQTANPIYLRINNMDLSNLTCASGIDVIDAEGILATRLGSINMFATLQFGIVKFEKIQKTS